MLRLREIKAPSNTIVYQEGSSATAAIKNTNTGDDEAGPLDDPLRNSYRRHQNGAHYLFADWHIEWRKPLSISVGEFTKDPAD